MTHRLCVYMNFIGITMSIGLVIEIEVRYMNVELIAYHYAGRVTEIGSVICPIMGGKMTFLSFF